MDAVTVRLWNRTLNNLGCGVGIKSPWRLFSPSVEDGEGQVLAAGPQMSTTGNRKRKNKWSRIRRSRLLTQLHFQAVPRWQSLLLTSPWLPVIKWEQEDPPWGTIAPIKWHDACGSTLWAVQCHMSQLGLVTPDTKLKSIDISWALHTKCLREYRGDPALAPAKWQMWLPTWDHSSSIPKVLYFFHGSSVSRGRKCQGAFLPPFHSHSKSVFLGDGLGEAEIKLHWGICGIVISEWFLRNKTFLQEHSVRVCMCMCIQMQWWEWQGAPTAYTEILKWADMRWRPKREIHSVEGQVPSDWNLKCLWTTDRIWIKCTCILSHSCLFLEGLEWLASVSG